ncbi:MAG: ribonuclease E inhibitor RraB [Marinicella sp.]|nr:ribonuclease E inhibitor RraB [Xanthomonadales bacterium]
MFGLFKKPGQFVTEADCQKNLERQIETTPMILQQLAQLNINESKALKVEYFFYTNTLEKAKALVDVLASRGYVGVAERSAHSRKEFVVTGWTTPIEMSEANLIEWTKDMCKLGLSHDCDFDGWGTTPEQ